jgi:hypothetical protein
MRMRRSYWVALLLIVIIGITMWYTIVLPIHTMNRLLAGDSNVELAGVSIEGNSGCITTTDAVVLECVRRQLCGAMIDRAVDVSDTYRIRIHFANGTRVSSTVYVSCDRAVLAVTWSGDANALTGRDPECYKINVVADPPLEAWFRRLPRTINYGARVRTHTQPG